MKLRLLLALLVCGFAAIGAATPAQAALTLCNRTSYILYAATAAIQQLHVSLEEAAENLGAGKASVLMRIVVPLMTGGLAAGFVTSFATAAVELSAVLMLVQFGADVDQPSIPDDRAAATPHA